MRIALCIDLSGTQQARLSSSVDPDEIMDRIGQDHPVNCLSGCEVVFGNPSPAWLSGAEELRWVQLESVGFGEYTALDWGKLGTRIVMSNLAGFFAEPVAESALAGILCLLRGINRLAHLQNEKQWDGDQLRTGLGVLNGAKVVMVGYGAINRRLAELLAPFSCRILILRSNSRPSELDEALSGADVVVCAAPDTPATRNVFNAARLARLPAHAIFVNFGRGSIVDEAALIVALAAKQLGGAVLDVTRSEPLPPDHALWTSPNVLLTQHSGGGTRDEIDRKIDHFLANLERYRRGETPEGIVDLKRGY